MNEPRLLFATEVTTADGEPARLIVMQTAGADRITIALEIGDNFIGLRLTDAQAVGLGSQLLGSNLRKLADFAQQMPEDLALEVGAAFLSNPAAAALLRKATEGQLPQ